MKTYAKLKDNKVTEIVKSETKPKGAIECDKPIYIGGRRYAGRLPKIGYTWDGHKFTA